MPEVEKSYGPVGSSLAFENDRVRIWELRLEPGEDLPVHHHELDYVSIEIAGDRIAGVQQPGSRGTTWSRSTEVEVEPGNFYFVNRGAIELATNPGTKPYRGIVIELKDSCGPAAPARAAAMDAG
jgi:hypothetical protein